jgi:hypothetical protein
MDVHRLAVQIHDLALPAAIECPEILTGYIQAEAIGYLQEAERALSAAFQIIEKGIKDHETDR